MRSSHHSSPQDQPCAGIVGRTRNRFFFEDADKLPERAMENRRPSAMTTLVNSCVENPFRSRLAAIKFGHDRTSAGDQYPVRKVQNLR